MIFSNYFGSVSNLCYFTSRKSIDLAPNADARSFKQWLYILSDISNYKASAPYDARKRNYQHLVAMIKSIKLAILALQYQYSVLVESDIIDTDNFSQHAILQIDICDNICNFLETSDFSNDSILIANDLMDELAKDCRTFFPDRIPEKYTWTDTKG